MAQTCKKLKGLFLDRDGVINVEKKYVHKIEDFIFLEHIFDLCRMALSKSYQIFIVTNQAGIGRGFYSESDFLKLNDWMIERFKSEHISIMKTYFCPFHALHGIGKYKQESYDRKPNPGMIIKALNEFNISAQSSILIGDNISDIIAGLRAGIKKNILLSDDCETSKLPYAKIPTLLEAFDHL